MQASRALLGISDWLCRSTGHDKTRQDDNAMQSKARPEEANRQVWHAKVVTLLGGTLYVRYIGIYSVHTPEV